MVCINVSIMEREDKAKVSLITCEHLYVAWYCGDGAIRALKLPSKYFGISYRSRGSVNSHGHQTNEVLIRNIFALHISTHVFSRHRYSIASHVAWEYAGSEIACEYQRGLSGISFKALFLDLYGS